MSGKLQIAWLTVCPSGHQVDTLKALASLTEIDMTVLYCSSISVNGSVGVKEPLGRGVLLRGISLRVPGGRVFINPGILSHILAKRYDLIVIGGYVHPTMILAMMVGSFQDLPWVFFGERPGISQKRRLARLVYRAGLPSLLKKASGIIATGTLAEREYQALCGSIIPVYSIPYLVDLDPFLNLKRRASSNGSMRFVFCGQLIRRKGVDTLLAAFVRLATVQPKAELYIVGEGPENENLRVMIPASLAGKVFFKGVVPFESRNISFEQTDILVHPARYDGWGVVVQEAMAAGLPVIGTRDTGAAFDLIEDGENGFLVNADDVEMLYQRMKWFVDHPQQVTTFGTRAREKASSYTPAWGAERFMEVTKRILNSSRRA